MNKNDIKFTDTVLLVDAGFIENVASDFRRHFSKMLSRELQKADLALFLECIALEAGVKPAERRVQVLFIYDPEHQNIESFKPSSLNKEIDSMAFKGNLGEFSLFSFQPSEMTTREQLFLESMKVVLDSAEVKNAIIIPSEQIYQEEINDILTKVDGKQSITLFGMNPISVVSPAVWQTMGYALMKALGIRADEL